MISAILSVALGLLSWFGGPMALPVFALALGANALVKERRASERRPIQAVLGGMGIFLGSVAALVLLYQQYV